jgi:hypothetical protein
MCFNDFDQLDDDDKDFILRLKLLELMEEAEDEDIKLTTIIQDLFEWHEGTENYETCAQLKTLTERFKKEIEDFEENN